MNKVLVTLALGSLVSGCILAADGTVPMLMVGSIFAGLGLGVISAMWTVDRVKP